VQESATRPDRLGFEDFVEAVSNAVLRALDARRSADPNLKPSLPTITVGVILRPPQPPQADRTTLAPRKEAAMRPSEGREEKTPSTAPPPKLIDEIDVGAQARAARLFTRIQKLITLDDIVTSVLKSPQEKDLQTLRIIASEMEHLYDFCVRQIAWVEQIISSQELTFQETLRAVIDNSPLTNDAKNAAREKFATQRGLIALVRRAAQELPGLASKEVEHLSREITEVELGRPARGDMSQETKCLLMGGACAACLFVPAAAGAGIGILVKILTDCT